MAVKWTVVQHSGYGYGGKPQFQKGLESAQVPTKAVQQQVLAEGGVLFDSYEEAEEWLMREQYPDPEYPGFVPLAPGRFADKGISGLAIYCPVAVEK